MPKGIEIINPAKNKPRLSFTRRGTGNDERLISRARMYVRQNQKKNI